MKLTAEAKDRRERASRRAMEWARKNPERRREIERRYAAKKTRVVYFRKYYQEHRSEFRKRKRSWEKVNRKKCSQQVGKRLLRHRAELRGWYVRRLLSAGSNVRPSGWPEILVETKRAELKLKRLWQRRKT